MEETRITGDLPGLRMEIAHRADPDGNAEHMVVTLTATPDFQSALPLVSRLGQIPLMMNPLAAWQAWMAPWAALAKANPFLAAPQPPDESAKK
jgi:hypothetical protein